MTYDLEELKRLEKAATPGEWEVENRPGRLTETWEAVYSEAGVVSISPTGFRATAEFIAAARNAMPAMLGDLGDALAMLQMLEWAPYLDGSRGHCLECQCDKQDGHAPGCALDALIQRLEGK